MNFYVNLNKTLDYYILVYNLAFGRIDKFMNIALEIGEGNKFKKAIKY